MADILKGTIKLEAPGAQRNLEILQAQLVRLQKIAGQTDVSFRSFERINKMIASTQSQINSFEKTIGKAGAATQKAAKDFTPLAHVIQDLPFGIIGIQNNITRLVPNVGLLSVGVSALAAGFTFAQIGLQNWSRLFPDANDKLKDQVKALGEAKQALADYVEVLNDANKIRVQGAQNAQEELIKLRTLYEATQNQNISLANRKKIVDELQEQYPKYFQNIKDEVILAGGAKSAYDDLANAILATARARAGQDLLVGVQKDLLTVEQQIADSEAKQLSKGKEIIALKASGAKLTYVSLKGEEQLTAAGAKMNKLEQSYNSIVSAGNKLLDQRAELRKRAENITSIITTEVQNKPGILLDPIGEIKKPKAGEKVKTEFLFNFLPFDPSGKLKPEQRSQLVDAIDKFSKEFGDVFQDVNFRTQGKTEAGAIDLARKWWEDYKKGIFQLKPQELIIDAVPDVSFDNSAVDKFIQGINHAINGEEQPPIIVDPEWEIKTKKFEEMLKRFRQDAASLIESTQENFAIGFGDALGDLFSGEGLDKAFKNVIGIMGDFISQLGKMLIKAGVAAEAFKKAFAALLANPAAAIGVGIGLVALGGIIKNSVLPKPKAFAEGGIVYGRTNAVFGEYPNARTNPEVVTPLDKLRNMIGGAGGTQVFIPTLEAGYDKVRLVFARANQKGGRY